MVCDDCYQQVEKICKIVFFKKRLSVNDDENPLIDTVMVGAAWKEAIDKILDEPVRECVKDFLRGTLQRVVVSQARKR